MGKDQKAFKWLNENTLSYIIWDNKYRANNESFDEWLDRVSGGNNDLRELIKAKKFLFGGRVLANRGLNNGASYFNCYTSGFVPDDYAGIMDVSKNLGLTYKKQGGQGINLSKIRPKGSAIHGGYTSDGVIPFLKLFNQVTESTSQGGSRKGAMIAILDACHKDIYDFIHVKDDLNQVTSANLSVSIDDDFMAKWTHATSYDMVFYHSSGTEEYQVNPNKILREIATAAWDNGEPGVIYWDRFTNYNLMQYIDHYQIEGSNPCGAKYL
jgi:ribonucleoside-diphosphate reductase alpha chain